MTFRECMQILEANYDKAALSYMEHAGHTSVCICAHGNGECGVGESYQQAMDSLVKALSAKTEIIPIDQSPEADA